MHHPGSRDSQIDQRNTPKTNECPAKIDGWKMKSHYLLRWHDTFQGISESFFKDPLLTIDSGLQYRHRKSMLCFGSIPKQKGFPSQKKTWWWRLHPVGPRWVYLQDHSTDLVHGAMRFTAEEFVTWPLAVLFHEEPFDVTIVRGQIHYSVWLQHFRRIGSGVPQSSCLSNVHLLSLKHVGLSSRLRLLITARFHSGNWRGATWLRVTIMVY